MPFDGRKAYIQMNRQRFVHARMMAGLMRASGVGKGQVLVNNPGQEFSTELWEFRASDQAFLYPDGENSPMEFHLVDYPVPLADDIYDPRGGEPIADPGGWSWEVNMTQAAKIMRILTRGGRMGG